MGPGAQATRKTHTNKYGYFSYHDPTDQHHLSLNSENATLINYTVLTSSLTLTQIQQDLRLNNGRNVLTRQIDGETERRRDRETATQSSAHVRERVLVIRSSSIHTFCHDGGSLTDEKTLGPFDKSSFSFPPIKPATICLNSKFKTFSSLSPRRPPPIWKKTRRPRAAFHTLSKGVETTTVGFHNFNLRIFNLRVSNPNKLIVDVCLTRCRISMCQGLGPNKHDEISEIDCTFTLNSLLVQKLLVMLRTFAPGRGFFGRVGDWVRIGVWNSYGAWRAPMLCICICIYIYIYMCIYIYIYTYTYYM